MRRKRRRRRRKRRKEVKEVKEVKEEANGAFSLAFLLCTHANGMVSHTNGQPHECNPYSAFHGFTLPPKGGMVGGFSVNYIPTTNIPFWS
jgi:hypothetical protein